MTKQRILFVILNKWSRTLNIDSSTYLPIGIKKYIPTFYNYFINNFSNLESVRKNKFDNNYHFTKPHNQPFNSKEILVYYLLNFKKYSCSCILGEEISIFSNTKNKKIEDNTKTINNFIELIDFIE